MTAAFLQEELAEELGKILSGIRLRNPQGEMSSIHIFEQLLPMPEPSDEEKIPEEDGERQAEAADLQEELHNIRLQERVLEARILETGG